MDSTRGSQNSLVQKTFKTPNTSSATLFLGGENDLLLKNFVNANSDHFPFLARVIRTSGGSISGDNYDNNNNKNNNSSRYYNGNNSQDYGNSVDDAIYYNPLLHHGVQKGSLLVIHGLTRPVKLLARSFDGRRCYAIPPDFRGLFKVMQKTFVGLEAFLAWQDDCVSDPLGRHMSPRIKEAKVARVPRKYEHLLRAGDVVRVKPTRESARPSEESTPEDENADKKQQQQPGDGGQQQGQKKKVSSERLGGSLEFYTRRGDVELYKLVTETRLESVVIPLNAEVELEELVQTGGEHWTVGMLTPQVQKRRIWVKLVQPGPDHPSSEENLPTGEPLELVQVVAEPCAWVSEYSPAAPAFHLPTRMDVCLRFVRALAREDSHVLNSKKQMVTSTLDRCVEHLPAGVFGDILRRGYGVTVPLVARRPIEVSEKQSRSINPSKQPHAQGIKSKLAPGNIYNDVGSRNSLNYSSKHARRPVYPGGNNYSSSNYNSHTDQSRANWHLVYPNAKSKTAVRSKSTSSRRHEHRPKLSSASTIRRIYNQPKAPLVTLTPPKPMAQGPQNQSRSSGRVWTDRRESFEDECVASIFIGRPGIDFDVKDDDKWNDDRDRINGRGGYDDRVKKVSAREVEPVNGRSPGEGYGQHQRKKIVEEEKEEDDETAFGKLSLSQRQSRLVDREGCQIYANASEFCMKPKTNGGTHGTRVVESLEDRGVVRNPSAGSEERQAVSVHGGKMQKYNRESMELSDSVIYSTPRSYAKPTKKKPQTISQSSVDQTTTPEFDYFRPKNPMGGHCEVGCFQEPDGEWLTGYTIKHTTLINTTSPQRDDEDDPFFPSDDEDGNHDDPTVNPSINQSSGQAASFDFDWEFPTADETAENLVTVDEDGIRREEDKTNESEIIKIVQTEKPNVWETEYGGVLEDLNIRSDGNLYELSKEDFSKLLRACDFPESLVQTCLNSNINGRSFAGMSMEDLDELGLKHTLITFFKDKTYNPYLGEE